MLWRIIWHTNGGPEHVDRKTYDEAWALALDLRKMGYRPEIRKL